MANRHFLIRISPSHNQQMWRTTVSLGPRLHMLNILINRITILIAICTVLVWNLRDAVQSVLMRFNELHVQ